MDNIEKSAVQLFEAADGTAVDKKLCLLKKKINEENRKRILEILIKYAYEGKVIHFRGFVVSDIVELVEENEKEYAEFFKSCMESDDSSKIYWGIKGYAKTLGENSYEYLSKLIFDNRYTLEQRASAIKYLSQLSNNTFDRCKPEDPAYWKECDINYEEIKEWIKNGFKRGNGYEEPLRHPSLDNPENKLEAIFARIDKKLKKLRDKEQDLSNPSNYLAIASHNDIEEINKKWKLPDVYLNFIKNYSPIKAELKSRDYGRVNVYGAHNLIKNQQGYSYNPVTKAVIEDWNKNFVVIADKGAAPFCIDVTMEDCPVYFALHGEGTWEFEKVYDTFIDFIRKF